VVIYFHSVIDLYTETYDENMYPKKTYNLFYKLYFSLQCMFNEAQEDSPVCKTGIVMKQTSGNVEIPCQIFTYIDTFGWIKECELVRHLLFCAYVYRMCKREALFSRNSLK
jgi:hypothetical protein